MNIMSFYQTTKRYTSAFLLTLGLTFPALTYGVAPTAVNDTVTGNVLATGSKVITEATLISNDSGDGIGIKSVTTPSTKGGTVAWANGAKTVTYTPGATTAAFQVLDDSETTTDTFVYTLEGTGGADDTATVTVTVAGVNDAPTISITNTNLATNDKAITNAPFTGATVGDVDVENVTVTVTLTPTAGGSLTNLNGFTEVGSTRVYSYTGTTANAQSKLRTLNFLPVENRVAPGTTENITLAVQVSDTDLTASDSRTVVVTSQNDTPTITKPANFQINDDVIRNNIFSAVTLADPDTGDFLDVRIKFDDRKGTFSGSGITKSGSNANSYITLTADLTVANANSILQALDYTPTPNRKPVGQTEANTFEFQVNDTTVTAWSVTSTLTVNVLSINEPPVVLKNTGSSTFNATAGASVQTMSQVTVTDPDVETAGTGEGTGENFVATIVLSGGTSSSGAIASSSFTLASTNTYTYTAKIAVLQQAIQAINFIAPNENTAITLTLTVKDLQNATSTPLIITVNVSVPQPGISGLQAGQELFDDGAIIPFSTAVFNSFGTQDRTVEVTFDDNVKGTFDILGLFVIDDTGSRIYRMVGNAVEATQALQNLRFNPTENRIVGASEIVTFTIKVKPDATSAALSTDIVSVTVYPVNNPPRISSDSPELRVNDDAVGTTPFTTITLADDDEGGTQNLTVTVSLVGQDPTTGTPLAGGGTLSIPDAVLDALIASNDLPGATVMSDVFNQLATPAVDSYQITGSPVVVNALLNGIVFTPEGSRNAQDERETIRFTILLEDGEGGSAQVSDITVIVTSVNGAPVIAGLPPLSQQPDPVAGTVNGPGFTVSFPFSGLTVTDDEIPNPSGGTMSDTLRFQIFIDDVAKGNLVQSDTSPSTVAMPGFITNDVGASYEMTGTPAQLTTALRLLEYRLSQTYPFTLAAPGATTFTLKATDSLPAGNITTKPYSIVIRQTSVAHIVTSIGDYTELETAVDGSLRQALENANNNDFIIFEFEPGDYPAVIRLKRVLDVQKNITIVGAGKTRVTISGDTDDNGSADVPLFFVSNGAQLTLDHLKLEDGSAASYGGAVSVEEDSGLTALDCSFIGNEAGQYGGAIDVYLGRLRVERCLFLNNSVLDSTAQGGGAVSVYTDGEASIINSTFVGNLQGNAGGAGGGAIYAENSDLSGSFILKVEHCTFKDNLDEAISGSAILSSAAYMTVQVRNNIFSDQQGVVLDVLGGGLFDSLGGNIATDATSTTYTTGGAPQSIVLLDNADDLVAGSTPVDPLLGALTDNGGATMTCAIGAASPAVNYAVAGATIEDKFVTDQRGVWRSGTYDSGAYEYDRFARMNINEIYLSNGTDSQFIEFYNPRDSESLNLENVKLYVDGVLAYTLGNQDVEPGNGFVIYDTVWEAGVELDAERGTLVLKTELEQTLLTVDYVANFSDATEAPALLDITGQSMTRYPDFEGPFLPHRRVIERVTGVSGGDLNSPGDDVTGAPLNGGNAPPLAIEDDLGYAVLANQTLNIDVLGNDIEFDRTDTLKITAILPLSSGSVTYDDDADGEGSNSNLTGSFVVAPVDPLVASPVSSLSPNTTVGPVAASVLTNVTDDAIVYDPTTSDIMIALSEGETIVDVWAYSVLDFAGTIKHDRDPLGDDGDAGTIPSNATRLENLVKATSYFNVTITGVNEAPVAGDDSAVTQENQAIRFLVDEELLAPAPFAFGDLDANYGDFDAMGNPVVLKPVLQTFSLLTNDDDVDNDNDNDARDGGLIDDIPTIEIINVHKTATTVNQATALSELGATVRLDIRSNRIESSIIYDPRSSGILNKLQAGEIATDTFYYTVRDQHGATDVAQVSVEITGVNDVPTANNDIDIYASEDETLVITNDKLLSNDTDPDQDQDLGSNDDALTIFSVDATTQFGALLSLNVAKTEITFDPTGIEFYEILARNEIITDEFKYIITDSNGGQSEATAFIEFVGRNDTPTADDDLLEIDENSITSVLPVNGLLADDEDIDINGTSPDDDPWVIPQRDLTTPLGAALTINADGSYSYDANSALIESLFEGEIVDETYPYIMTDNSRTSASDDNYKMASNSQDIVLPVLSNDAVAGSVPVAITAYADNGGSSLIIESTNHALRDGLLIKVEGYQGTGSYNGVYPISSIDRDHFSIPVVFADDPAPTRGTWRPWFKITNLGASDKNGNFAISADAQSIIYTPAVDFYGTETFTYTIKDGAGAQDVAVVELLVIEPPFNSVLSAEEDVFKVYRDQDPVIVDVLINDFTLPGLGSELTILSVSPEGAGLTIVNVGKALSYQPAAAFTGDESFTYTVSGGDASTTQATVTFKVGELEDFVTPNPDAFFVVTGSSHNDLDVLANDASLPNFPVTLELLDVTPSASANATVVAGKIRYTPSASIIVGTDSFTYTVRDEIGNEIVQTAQVKVVANTSNFYAIVDNYVVWAGGPQVELSVLLNDGAVGANNSELTITNLGLDTQAPPDVGRVAYTGGAIFYTPPSTVPVGGMESFTYEIGDGSGSSERREALIQVTIVDGYPTLLPEDDAFSVARDATAQTLDVLNNDATHPVVGWQYTIASVGATSHGGSVSIVGGATLSYVPAEGFYGIETFDYTVEDAFGQSEVATVTVMVGMQVTAPDAYVVLENSADNGLTVLTNDDWLNRYAADYTISLTSTPDQGGAVSIDVSGPNNQLLYTPLADFVGQENFTYTVIDSSGGTVSETVTVEVISEESDRAFANLVIRVTGVNDAPVLAGTEGDEVTDKESTFPFDTVTLSDVDEGGDQEQTVTINFDENHGELYSEDVLLVTTGGEYVIVGTPSEVVAALLLIEFRPFENLIPFLNPGYFDSVFTLTIDDGYLVTLIQDDTTIRVFAVNDPPNISPDVSSDVANDLYATEENQAIRLLSDATLLSNVFNFGDLNPDWQEFDATGAPVTLLPELQSPHLLDNDFDVDIDNDTDPLDGGSVDVIPTIKIVSVHETATPVDQVAAMSALGATVTLDIRAIRAETSIIYDPRSSSILNALSAGETTVDTFYYTVVDQHGAVDQVLVSITVTGVNDVPTANDDVGYELTEDGSIIISGAEILSNDTDPDQDTSNPDDAPAIVNFPALSLLGATLGFDGTDISYNPDDMEQYESLARNEFITDSITYTISDANGGTSMATIELEVEGLNDTPVAANDALAIDENDTQTRDRASGLISNDSDVDMGIAFNGGEPNDDPWILPQRSQTSPLGAAFYIETDGSYRYDANSRTIDSLYENEIAVETFPYVIIDNSRLSASQDSFKVSADSEGVVLPVLSNDDVAGSIPVSIEGFSADTNDANIVIIESFEHPLREGMLAWIQGHDGAGEYNGVYPISVVDRDHFSVAIPFVNDTPVALGTWRPWFEVTAVGETDQGGVVEISGDGQSVLYTPLGDFYGSELFEYTIKDGVGGQDVAIVELTVLQSPLNTVLSASDDRFQVGMGETAVEVDVLVNDNILPALGSAYSITTVSAGSAGGSVTISAGSDTLIYTPVNTTFVGSETFTYDVSGGGASSTQATVTFDVIDREEFLDSSPDAFFVVEDSTGNLLDVAANDASLPSFPVSFDVVAVSTPTSGSASVVGGQVSYTPNASFVGPDSFTYTIRDASGGYSIETVDVEVVPNVDNFYARNDHYIIVAGTGYYVLPLLANDGATGANSTALEVINLGLDTQAPPDGSRVDLTAGVVTYTVPAGATTEVFNYEIDDGTSERREAIITITVIDQLPTLPNALDDDYHVAKNSADHRLDVLLNDLPLPNAGWAWSITSVGTPNQGASVTIDAAAAVIYTPAEGFYGVESFDYTIEDAFGDSSTATVTVTVGAQLTEPDVYVVLENSTDNDLAVLVNDDIIERFPSDYTISQVSATNQGGAVAIDGSGPNNQLLYAPAAGFIGEETFTYTVIDNTGDEMSETVTVVVLEENADRDFANFVVTLTGINDITNIANTPDGSTTDKLSVKPFPSVVVTDLDEDDLQDQITTVSFDASFGTISAPGFSVVGTGVYRMTGTPAEVSTALQAIVFTPYENFIDYIDYGIDNSIGDVDFTLSIDDLNLGPVLGDSADAPVVDVVTINIEPINDAPTLVSPIADILMRQNDLPRAVLLPPHFADVDDDIPGGELVWTVAGNTNPSFFASVSVDPVKQILVFTLAEDQFGVSEITVRATDRGLLFVETSFTVTVQGPPVIVLDPGQTQPEAPVFILGSQNGTQRDYRQAFRLENTGTLPIEAFIVNVNILNDPIYDVVIIGASYSVDENGTPPLFTDDITSTLGSSIFRISQDTYQIKYDVPLLAGESVVVHFTYRAYSEQILDIQTLIEIELTNRTRLDGGMTIETAQPNDSGEMRISFQVEAGQSYRLEYSSDLLTWTPWLNPIPVSNFPQVITVVDDGLNTDPHPYYVPQRFYRLVEITLP